MYKEVLFGSNVRSKILKWVNTVGDAVTSTLWPRWTHVIFEDSSFPVITKDWVTVAQQIMLEDKFENMWVFVAREAAEKTNRNAWDGTTSTIAILQAILNEWHKYVEAWMNPVLIKRGMDEASKVIVELLEKKSKNVISEEEKLNIATISANNSKELWELIVSVINEVGKDWVVTVTNSSNENTEVEYVKGTRVESGYAHPAFVNDAKRWVNEFSNPAIIVCDEDITQQNQVIPLAQMLIANGKTNAVLFASSIEWSALAFLIQNHLMGKFTIVPVRLPSFSSYQKDLMRDLSSLTNAKILGENQAKTLKTASIEDVGSCENLVIGRNYTIISWGKWNIEERIEEIKSLLETETDTFVKEKLKDRLGKISGKVASIRVWGSSVTEQTEIKYRIEDAINSTKSAMEEWIVEWAGTTLLRCSTEMEITPESPEFNAWVEIVRNAICKPFKKIIENGGWNADAIMWKVLESWVWYNSLKNCLEDLFVAGIIDPKKVVKNEVINSIATAWILLTSSVGIATVEEKK